VNGPRHPSRVFLFDRRRPNLAATGRRIPAMAPSARFPSGAEELLVLTVPTAGPAGPVQEKMSIPRWMSEAMKK
jgi:hypothetical protein